MNIREALQQKVDGFASFGEVMLLEMFVLRKGSVTKPRRRIGRKMPDKNCFENAMSSLRGIQRRHPTALYAEGFAASEGLGIPLHHAWIDIDGKAMDPTWTHYQESHYFGVTFTPEQAWAETVKHGYYGLLAADFINTKLLFRLDPELRAIAATAKSGRVQKMRNHSL